MKKLILTALICVIPNFAFSADLNLNVSKDIGTKSTSVNIISVDDTIFDKNGVSQTLVLFNDDGLVYYSIQSGRSCNYKPGNAKITSTAQEVIITPNSSCDIKSSNIINESW